MKKTLNKMNLSEFKEYLDNKKIKYNESENMDFPFSDIVEVCPKSKDYKSRNFDVHEIKLDITKVKQEFSWQPNINIEDGINNQFIWMQKMLSLSK